MKKIFLLIPLLAFAMMANATTPTITVDGDKSDWAEVPMLTEPGTWPMLKVLPAADAELGTNALVYMMEHTEDFDQTWAKYPTEFIDKDYDGSTHTIDAYWGFSAMGLEYRATTGVNVNSSWISFPKAMSSDNKVFEIGFPATYITDLGEKFGFAMYYNSGAWFCPDRSEPAVNSFSPENGFLYKTRSFTTVAGTTNLTTTNVYAHPSMGEVGEYVDFGLRDNGYDTIRWAAFPIDLTAPAVYDVTTNVTTPNNTNYKFELWLVDVASNAVVAHIARPASSVSSASYKCGTLDLREVPAGKYMLKVMNKKAYSKVQLNSIDLTYAGGNTVAIPGTLGIDDAVITNGKRQDGAIKFDNALTGTAEWKVSVASDAYMNIATTIKNKYGHNITISVFEEDGVTPVGSVTEGGNKYTNNTEGLLINLGGLYLNAGNYVVKYSNATDGSDAKPVNIAFTYVGGAVQNMPGTTNLADAWFSNNGTRADGKISYSSINDGCWAKWNINVAAAGNFNVTVNISGQYGHDYSVEFLKEGETTPIVVTKNATNYTNDATLYANELGSVILEAANYEMTVSNAVGDAALHSVKLSYAGGGTVALPATLQPMDAVLEQWEVAEGKISGTEDNATTGSALWNVSSNGGQYKFKLNYTSDNGHLMKVEIFEEGSQTAKYTWNESSTTQWSTGDFEADLGTFELEDKDYVIKVTNAQPNSHAKVTNIVATYLGGAISEIPGTLPLADALLSANAYRNDGATELHFIAPENVEFIADEYAIWNVQATAGLYDFTLNVVGTNYGIYQIIVKDSENNVKFTGSKGKSANGSVTISNVLIAADGNYTIQIANINNYADGYLTGVSAEKQDNVVILDENATTNDVLADPEVYNQSKKIALNRTFKGGMYNTICLPFEIGSQGTMESVFGVGYELLQLNDATLSDGGVLNLSFDPVITLARGVPYLIRPAADVINPVISSRKIKSTSVPDYTRGVVDFVGTYIMGTIPASESNLFMGPNNTLYFPTGDTPIKGLRAWFRVNVPGANQVIKRARIVTQGQVITEIDLVNEPNNGAVKTLENGQLIIIKNGVRYNGLGIMIK